MAWNMYRLHKWLAVSVSAFLFIWATTGIVMTLPAPSTLPATAGPRAPVDYTAATVSPAQATQAVLGLATPEAQVAAVTLKRLLDRVVYQVDLRPGGSRLIDARTGEQVTVTAELAEQVAREAFPADTRVRSVERLEQHSFLYPGGPLPTYRVAFDDDRATVSYVSIEDGTLRRSTRWTRVRTGFVSLHDFSGFNVVVSSREARHNLMILLSVISVIAIGTGWYLAVPRRRRSRA